MDYFVLKYEEDGFKRDGKVWNFVKVWLDFEFLYRLWIMVRGCRDVVFQVFVFYRLYILYLCYFVKWIGIIFDGIIFFFWKMVILDWQDFVDSDS